MSHSNLSPPAPVVSGRLARGGQASVNQAYDSMTSHCSAEGQSEGEEVAFTLIKTLS